MHPLWVLLRTSPFAACKGFSLSLEGKRGGGAGVGPEEEHQRLSRQPSVTRQGATTGSSDKGRLTSAGRGGRAALAGKEDSVGLRDLMSPTSLGSSHTSPFQCSAFYFFPINSMTLTKETLWGWKFNLYCNSATHRVRLWVWCSEILALQLQEIGFLSEQT